MAEEGYDDDRDGGMGRRYGLPARQRAKEASAAAAVAKPSGLYRSLSNTGGLGLSSGRSADERRSEEVRERQQLRSDDSDRGDYAAFGLREVGSTNIRSAADERNMEERESDAVYR